MNTGVKVDPNLEGYSDPNMMEIREGCIYSIAPIYDKALKDIYSFQKIKEILPQNSSARLFALQNYNLYKNPLNENGKGDPFQRCVEYVLAFSEKKETSTDYYNNLIIYSYSGEDEQFMRFCCDSLMILTNPSFNFVDFILFKKETSKSVPSNYLKLNKNMNFHKELYLLNATTCNEPHLSKKIKKDEKVLNQIKNKQDFGKLK